MSRQVGQLTVAIDQNSIGAKSTGVSLGYVHTASFDGQHVVRFKADAACQIQVTDTANEVSDTGLLENGKTYAASGLVEIPQFQISGHTYDYAMVFSTGAPSCDIFAVLEIEQRGDN